MTAENKKERAGIFSRILDWVSKGARKEQKKGKLCPG